jgi:hypothetical protein
MLFEFFLKNQTESVVLFSGIYLISVLQPMGQSDIVSELLMKFTTLAWETGLSHLARHL